MFHVLDDPIDLPGALSHSCLRHSYLVDHYYPVHYLPPHLSLCYVIFLLLSDLVLQNQESDVPCFCSEDYTPSDGSGSSKIYLSLLYLCGDVPNSLTNF